VRELVMVIADLYLPRGTDAAAPELAASFAPLPGIESAGRFGERAALAHGWREWLASHVGRADLCGLAPACVAAAAQPQAAGGATVSWIATPVHLSAGLTRLHLDHRGLLRLLPAELAALASDFRRTFTSPGFSLVPLSSGDFLLSTSGLPCIATPEPARCAGGDVAQCLPQGPGAAPLRRLVAELEMWLHAQALNEARLQRDELPVSALWLWGCEGRTVAPEQHAAQHPGVAFGADAWLAGLWHLQRSACRALPERLEEVLAQTGADRAVVVAQVGGELQRAREGSLAQALARLDQRFVSPALQALRRGELARVTLLLNDVAATLRHGSRLRFWRPRRAGLGGFA
jgi:hypothetical protein